MSKQIIIYIEIGNQTNKEGFIAKKTLQFEGKRTFKRLILITLP